jgi:hypothetical protein
MVAPTMVITAAEGTSPIVSTIASIPTLSMTFTSDQTTTNFVIGDITVANGVMSSFAGAGATYTATFTPTAGFNGDCTIRVLAGAYTNAGAENNVATDIFYYTVNAPVVQGVEFEGDFPLTVPVAYYKAISFNSLEFEGDFPYTVPVDDYKKVALHGIMFEGDFPAPSALGLAVLFSSS